MEYSPLLILHIAGGATGLVSGAAAMTLRKGTPRHARAGGVFVVSMLTMAGAGTALAVMKDQISNVFGGVLTFYLVVTAWAAARRREREVWHAFDRGAMAFAFLTALGILGYGVAALESPTGEKAGVPAGMFFFLGTVAMMAASGDARMILRGGVSGAGRMVRHLWRMCFGLFIAAASIFIARPQLFPAWMSSTGTLTVLGVLPLGMLIFWVARVRFGARRRRLTVAATLG